MHPFSVLTLGIFVAGYITARWDLVTRLYELAIFAWDHGVVVSTSALDTLIKLTYMVSGARNQRLRHLIDFLLPVHNTYREVGISRDEPGSYHQLLVQRFMD